MIATMPLGLDPDHERVRLAGVIPWDALTADLGPLSPAGNGCPTPPIRLMAGLHFLKHRICEDGAFRLDFDIMGLRPKASMPLPMKSTRSNAIDQSPDRNTTRSGRAWLGASCLICERTLN